MITVENLSFTYHGAGQPALQELNFSIHPGEIFGFLGPSGAGKSTTQKIMTGLLREYQGRVAIFNRDLRAWDASYYEKIGVSFEFPNHFLKLTGLENLRYFRALYRVPTREPEELLAWVGLSEDGDVPVGQYSKGMKHRLTFVRALLHDPELLFLDEPTAGLDPVNARRIKELIREQQGAGRTIFLTTHDMNVADELCDRVAFIVDGRILKIGAPRALKLEYGQPSVRVEFAANGRQEARDFPLQNLGEDAGFLALLRAGSVQTIHTQEATLEDVFIQVTGRRLA